MIHIIEIVVICAVAPFLYAASIFFFRDRFHEEEHRKVKPYGNVWEFVMTAASIAALICSWFALGKCGVEDLYLELIFLALVLSMTAAFFDRIENIIPNRLLLYYIVIYGIVVALHFVFEFEYMKHEILYIVTGFVFSALVFGLVYLIMRGGIGAGDVKYAIVLGLYLTGRYIVGALIYASILSLVFAIIMMARKKMTRKDFFPFAPFIFAGTIIRFIVG